MVIKGSLDILVYEVPDYITELPYIIKIATNKNDYRVYTNKLQYCKGQYSSFETLTEGVIIMIYGKAIYVSKDELVNFETDNLFFPQEQITYVNTIVSVSLPINQVLNPDYIAEVIAETLDSSGENLDAEFDIITLETKTLE